MIGLPQNSSLMASASTAKDLSMINLHTDYPLINAYNEIQFDQFIIKLISISRGLGILNSDKSSMKTVATFINNQFGKDLTMNEVTFAFDLNSAKKLDCDTKPYTTFNLEYVGEVLSAYKEYRKHALSVGEKEKQRALEPPVQTIEWMEHAKMMHGIIEDYISKHKKLPIAADWEAAYDYLVSVGKIKMSNEQMQQLKTSVKARLHQELSQKKFSRQDYKQDEMDLKDEKFIRKVCREDAAKVFYQKLI